MPTKPSTVPAPLAKKLISHYNRNNPGEDPSIVQRSVSNFAGQLFDGKASRPPWIPTVDWVALSEPYAK
jgi:hypothetical protein